MAHPLKSRSVVGPVVLGVLMAGAVVLTGHLMAQSRQNQPLTSQAPEVLEGSAPAAKTVQLPVLDTAAGDENTTAGINAQGQVIRRNNPTTRDGLTGPAGVATEQTRRVPVLEGAAGLIDQPQQAGATINTGEPATIGNSLGDGTTSSARSLVLLVNDRGELELDGRRVTLKTLQGLIRGRRIRLFSSSSAPQHIVRQVQKIVEPNKGGNSVSPSGLAQQMQQMMGSFGGGKSRNRSSGNAAKAGGFGTTGNMGAGRVGKAGQPGGFAAGGKGRPSGLSGGGMMAMRSDSEAGGISGQKRSSRPAGGMMGIGAGGSAAPGMGGMGGMPSSRRTNMPNVMMQTVRKKDQSQIRMFYLKHVPAEDAESILKQLFRQPNNVVATNPQSNTLVVRAEKDALEQMEAILLQLERTTQERRKSGNPMAGSADGEYDSSENLGMEGSAGMAPRPAAPIDTLRRRFEEANQRAVQLASRAARSGRGGSNQQLENAVREAFDFRQRLQVREAQQLRSRLASIEQRLQRRQQLKSRIIKKRVDSLVQSFRSKPGVSGTDSGGGVGEGEYGLRTSDAELIKKRLPNTDGATIEAIDDVLVIRGRKPAVKQIVDVISTIEKQLKPKAKFSLIDQSGSLVARGEQAALGKLMKHFSSQEPALFSELNIQFLPKQNLVLITGKRTILLRLAKQFMLQIKPSTNRDEGGDGGAFESGSDSAAGDGAADPAATGPVADGLPSLKKNTSRRPRTVRPGGKTPARNGYQPRRGLPGATKKPPAKIGAADEADSGFGGSDSTEARKSTRRRPSGIFDSGGGVPSKKPRAGRTTKNETGDSSGLTDDDSGDSTAPKKAIRKPARKKTAAGLFDGPNLAPSKEGSARRSNSSKAGDATTATNTDEASETSRAKATPRNKSKSNLEKSTLPARPTSPKTEIPAKVDSSKSSTDSPE